MARYPATPAQPAAEPPFMVESRVPVGPSRLETHVIVPFFQVLITMLLVGANVLLWQWHPLAGAVGAIGLVVWVWRILLGDRLLWGVERMTGWEVTGDNVRGKPHDVTLLNMSNYTPPSRHQGQSPLRHQVEQRRAQNVAAAERSTETKRALLAFVLSCYAFGSTSERAHGIQPWQRKRYLDFRDALMTLGIADWKDATNPRLGWEMVAERDIAVALIEERVL